MPINLIERKYLDNPEKYPYEEPCVKALRKT
jgi:hypothetical protein